MTVRRQVASHLRRTLVMPAVHAALLVIASPLVFSTAFTVEAAGTGPKIYLPFVSSSSASVRIKGITNDQVVSGKVVVEGLITPRASIVKVEFFIGKDKRWTEDRAPYYLGGVADGRPNGYDTRQLRDGSHTIKVVATDIKGRATEARVQVTVANVSAVAPAPATAPAPILTGKTVLQGHFYDRPSDGTSTSTAAQRARVVILGRGVGWYRDLKSAGFSGIGLEYLMANEVNGPWTTPGSSCDSSHVPPQNTVAYNKGDFCKYVHPNESWFLHNSKGQRLYGRRGDGKGFNYHMNPASEGWRRFVSSRVVRDLIGDSTQAKKGFDGIYLDNVALRTYKLRHQITNSDGTVREYSSDSAYRSAVRGHLSAVRSAIGGAGPLWANLIDDEGVNVNDYMPLVNQLDGLLSESWAMTYPSQDNHFSASQWNNVLTIAEQTLSKGKGVFAVVQGSKGNYERQRFGLASYLLVSNMRHSYFRYGSASNYNSWWQYDNYNMKLGAPKGKRYQAGSTWRRDFECGYVEVNPTARTGRIVQTCR